MNIQEKIKFYTDYFDIIKRGDKDIAILKDNAPEELRNSVMEAHGEKLPDDFVYDKYQGILSSLQNYTINNIDDVEENRSEIVDSLIDPYTSSLTEWLNSDNRNVYYLTEVLEEYEEKDGFKLLSMAQYTAIDEIYSYVIDLLSIK